MAANILREANVVTNFNTIPFDPQPPTQGSGIRPGSPCLTSRGMKEEEMTLVANLMADVLSNPDNANIRQEVKEKVIALARRFPIYSYLAEELV
jgi:glycine hydroxymethyltransferase